MAVGIGVLSKYNFVLLPVVAALALLPDRQLRARLFDVRVLLMVAVSAAIVAPHALWFLDHMRRGDRPHVHQADQWARTAGGSTRSARASFRSSDAVAAFALPTVLAFAVAFGPDACFVRGGRKASGPG